MPCVLRWNFSFWLAVTDGLESIRSQIQHNEQIICGHCTYNTVDSYQSGSGRSVTVICQKLWYVFSWTDNGTVKCFSACFECVELTWLKDLLLFWFETICLMDLAATLETTTFRDSDLETVLITILINNYLSLNLNSKQWLHFKLWMLRWQQRQCHWDQIKFLSLTQLLLVDWLFIRNSAVLS